MTDAEIEDLRVKLASAKSVILRIVADIFSPIYAAGNFVDSNNQPVLNGSTVELGSRLKFSMRVRAHQGEEIKSHDFSCELANMVLLSINDELCKFDETFTDGAGVHCDFTLDTVGELRVEVLFCRPCLSPQFETLYTCLLYVVSRPRAFRLVAVDAAPEVPLAVHSSEAWSSSVVIVDQEGNDVICSQSELRAYFRAEPDSAVIQPDGLNANSELDLAVVVSATVGEKRKADGRGSSFEVRLSEATTLDPLTRGTYRLNIEWKGSGLPYVPALAGSSFENVVKIVRHRDPREWSGVDCLTYLAEELEFTRKLDPVQLLGKLRDGKNLYSKRQMLLWIWLGLSEDDEQLPMVEKAIAKLERLAVDSDFSKGQFGQYLKGSIREGNGPSDLQLENPPFDYGGFAAVYRGRYRGQIVAAKVPRGEFGRDLVDGLQEEARKLRLCGHRNVVACLGMMIGPLPSNASLMRVGLVMEYCSNGSLRRYVEAGRLSDWAECVAAAYDVAKGLEYLHGHDSS